MTACLDILRQSSLLPWRKQLNPDFDVLLTVHISIILAVNQLNVQNLLL